MLRSLVRKIIHVNGMKGAKCEEKIENALKKLDGIAEVKAIYCNSNIYVAYDSMHLKIQEIVEIVEQLGYTVILAKGKNEPDINDIMDSSGVKIEAKVLLLLNRILSPNRELYK